MTGLDELAGEGTHLRAGRPPGAAGAVDDDEAQTGRATGRKGAHDAVSLTPAPIRRSSDLPLATLVPYEPLMNTPRPEQLLRLFEHGDASRPRLTWYADGERIELSGRVLANWVSKATNLLLEEFDVEPGARLAVHLPVHWRAFYWALAGWTVGAVVLTDPAAQADVRIVLAGTPADGDVVAVTPAALARAAQVDLPAGHLDEAAVLATYGDVADADGAQPGSPALEGPAGAFTVDDLLASAPPPGARIILPPDVGLDVALRQASSTWAVDGSVVVLDAGWAAGRSEEEIAHLRQVESVTAQG